MHSLPAPPNDPPLSRSKLSSRDIGSAPKVPDAPELRSIDQPVVATTGVMTSLIRQAKRIAANDLTTLITGESGTGKTTIARLIHTSGPRASRPFVAVNCASLPRDLIEAELFGHARGAFTGAVIDRAGRVEVADGGTLLLDEIGDLPLELQPKLLTFLQDQTFQRIGSDEMHQANVRVVAATNQNLVELCQQKKFREDLYFRINVLSLHVPPLRERRNVIPELVSQILARIARRQKTTPPRIDQQAMIALSKRDWPGNVRELENVLERACVFGAGDSIKADDLVFDAFPIAGVTESPGPQTTLSLAGRTLADIEKQALSETLEACHGNKAMAARELGISERSIYNKLRRHELSY